jgi:hypothetical protein
VKPRSRTSPAALAAVAALTLSSVVWGPACRKNPEVTFDITIPAGLQADTQWYEIGAFRDATCAAVRPQIAGGLPLDGSVLRVAFSRDERPIPALGDLAKAKYAFAAVAKRDDCTVLAIGCSENELSDDRAIKIDLQATEAGLGACPKGAVCRDAQCLPAIDNNDPAVGAGCSLELLGAGPLANPLGADSYLSAPAVSAIEGGFLVGYKEVDSRTGRARRIVVPVDAAGGFFSSIVIGMDGRCAGSEESDGAGLATNPSGSLLGFARAPCAGKGGGLDLIALDPPGNDVAGGYNFVALQDVSPRFSTSHAIASKPGSADFLLALTDRDRAIVVPVTNGATKPTATATSAAQFHCGVSTDSYVGISDRALALVSVGPGGAPAPVVDAGPEGGASDAGGGGGSDAGAGGTSVRVLPLKAQAKIDSEWCKTTQPPAAASFAGSWASVAVSGNRILVVSDNASTSRPISYHAYEPDKVQPVSSGDFAIEGNGKVLYADVAVRGDRMFVAAERAGALSLVSFTGATTAPIRQREVVLADNPRVPSLKDVRDGRVAVTATDTRVAVAWTTGRQLGPNDAAGGYAVFACTP